METIALLLEEEYHGFFGAPLCVCHCKTTLSQFHNVFEGWDGSKVSKNKMESRLPMFMKKNKVGRGEV